MQKGFEKDFDELKKQIILFDTGPAPVKKIEGKARWQILIKVLNRLKTCRFPKKVVYLFGQKEI